MLYLIIILAKGTCLLLVSLFTRSAIGLERKANIPAQICEIQLT